MSLPFAIALRFLFRSTKSRSLTLFTLISILGITFSVMLFVLIDSLINGLSTNLRETLIGFEAPLQLEISPNDVVNTQMALNQFIKTNNKFDLRYLYTRQFDGLIAAYGQPPTAIKARSVNSNFFKIKKDQLQIYWLEGFNEENFTKSENFVLVGESVFERLRFLPGDEEIVTITHPFGDLGPGGEIEPVERNLYVAGIFSTGRADFDDVYVLISDNTMSAMANNSLLENKFFLFPKNILDAPIIKKLWNNNSSHQQPLQTWFDKNKNILRAMQLEKLMYFLIFLFVMLISSFNLAGVISIFSLSKAGDSAILNSLGLAHASIRQIFMRLGLILGSFGAFLGVGIGLLLIIILKASHFSLPRAYGFTELPLDINFLTIFGLLIGTPIVAMLISYYPALKLTKGTVAEVLRLS